MSKFENAITIMKSVAKVLGEDSTIFDEVAERCADGFKAELTEMDADKLLTTMTGGSGGRRRRRSNGNAASAALDQATTEAVAKALAEMTEPASAGDVAKACGIETKAVSKALAAMVEAGTAVKTGQKRGTKYAAA
jgi:predicted HTH transcriptional regulator